MADISTFPTIPDPLVYKGGAVVTMTGAGSVDIEPGMAVDFDDTGVTMTVQAALAVSGDTPAGCATTHSDVSASGKVGVALNGNVCNMANEDDTTAIDTGDWVITANNAIGGTIIAGSVAATGVAEGSIQINVVGKALEDIAGGGFGHVLICCMPITRPNST